MTASLRLKRDNIPSDRYGIVLCVETMAWIAAGLQQHQRAATLLGAADTLWNDLGTTITAHGALLHCGIEGRGERPACQTVKLLGRVR